MSTRTYSLLNAVRLAMDPRTDAEGCEYERDIHLELAQTSQNDQSGGIFVPVTVLSDMLVPELGTLGITRRMGARSMTLDQGCYEIPTDEGGAVAYNVDTESFQKPTASAAVFGSLKLSPAMISTQTRVSYGYARQTNGNGEAALRRILARKIEAMEDRRAFDALRTIPGVNVVNFSGATFTGGSQDVTKLTADMIWGPLIAGAEEANPRWGYVGEPEIGKKFAAGKTSSGLDLLFPFGPKDLRGVSAQWSHLARAVADTAGTSDAGLFAGDWSRMIHVRWGAIVIRATEQDNDASLMRATIVANMPHQVVMERPEAFSRASALSAS